MHLKGYTVEVIGGVEETQEGYVLMKDGSTFKIWLRNHNARCSAEVKIDGKSQGKFVLEQGVEYNPIERGVQDRGLFTFYKLGTQEAYQAGLPSVSTQETGLIQVTFKPEKARVRDIFLTSSGGEGMKSGGGSSMRTRSYSAGGVGLSGLSSQNFNTTSFSVNEDPHKWTVISLRLICDDSLSGPRPLTGNKVPASI